MKLKVKGAPLRQVLLGSFVYIGLSSCAPVFSDLQSARTAGQGNVELTPSFSTVNFSSDGESDHVQNHVGLQAAYGVTDKFDLRLRYEAIWLGEELDDGTVNVLGLGAKYNFIEDILSLYVPIGTGFGDEVETNDSWQMQPTLLVTLPAVQDKLDITLAPKYLLTFCEGCDDLFALNFGMAFGDLNNWAVRPEYGMLFNPGEDGYYGQFSIGLSYTFNAH